MSAVAPRAPGHVPLLGHAIQLRLRPLQFLAELAEHGTVVELRLGTAPAYLVGDPKVAHQVLLDARTFEKGGPLYRELASLLGDSLATSTRERHRRQRRMVQPSFQHSRMPAYASVMTEEIDQMLATFAPGRVVDFARTCRTLTLRVVARALFSSGLSDAAMGAVERHLPEFSLGVYRRMTHPVSVMKRLSTPSSRRFVRATVCLRAAISQVIAECSSGGMPSDCVMADMLAYRDESGRPLSERELVDHSVVLFLAGAETSATTIAWAFHALAANPEVERALHTEVDSVLSDGRPVELADLPRLDYTCRYVTEVLRRYPAIWVLTRTAMAETMLGEVTVPAGSGVIVSPYALHRNPRMFPDPTRIDPGRWLPERAQNIPRGAWLPFGAGSRKCVGEEFGMIETVLTVAAVAARWRLRPPARGVRVKELPMTSLATGPMPMRLEPRGATGPRKPRGAPPQ
ncbi:cytochrome P450 [Pseudonocardia eucalypti]|uniref:Cytochrome P450 n=1 Tax=Pseudonocardia eucalypti TaxID=648755 RepID=A0ABP9Q9A9_9PSEU|nr:pentalenene oxygenase [Pseudonocardia eucalypti]